MTNLEWFKKRINEMSAEEINRLWYDHKEPWCSDDRCNYGSCSDCMMEWINQPHIDPMPELKVGMFIEAQGKLGVVVNGITIAYQDGTWSNLDEAIITKIFTKNAICFKLCTDKYIMWRRN